jgi:hypothetical protein
VVSRRIPADRAARLAADLITECIEVGLAAQWRKRAEMFEWARPRPEDFLGRARRASVEETDRRLRELAQACRNRAEVIELDRAG